MGNLLILLWIQIVVGAVSLRDPVNIQLKKKLFYFIQYFLGLIRALNLLFGGRPHQNWYDFDETVNFFSIQTEQPYNE